VARIAQIEDGLPKESYYGKRQDAPVSRREIAKGELAHWSG
jgi:hypothetical protein